MKVIIERVTNMLEAQADKPPVGGCFLEKVSETLHTRTKIKNVEYAWMKEIDTLEELRSLCIEKGSFVVLLPEDNGDGLELVFTARSVEVFSNELMR